MRIYFSNPQIYLRARNLMVALVFLFSQFFDRTAFLAETYQILLIGKLLNYSIDPPKDILKFFISQGRIRFKIFLFLAFHVSNTFKVVFVY